MKQFLVSLLVKMDLAHNFQDNRAKKYSVAKTILPFTNLPEFIEFEPRINLFKESIVFLELK